MTRDNELLRRGDVRAALSRVGIERVTDWMTPTPQPGSWPRPPAALPTVAPALHRSFPEAGDGRPLPPMGDELMTAGLNAEDARFVAVQLAQNGWTLTPNPVDVSPGPDPVVKPTPTLAEALAVPEVKALVEAAQDAEYDLLQWIACTEYLTTAGFNMDGTPEVADKLTAALRQIGGEG